MGNVASQSHSIDFYHIGAGQTLSSILSLLKKEDGIRVELINLNQGTFTNKHLTDDKTFIKRAVIKIDRNWFTEQGKNSVFQNQIVKTTIALAYEPCSVANNKKGKVPFPSRRFVLCFEKNKVNSKITWGKPVLLLTGQSGILYKVNQSGSSLKTTEPAAALNSQLHALKEKIVGRESGKFDFNYEIAKLLRTFFTDEQKHIERFIDPFFDYRGALFNATPNQEYYMMFAPLDVLFTKPNRLDSGYITSGGQNDKKYNLNFIIGNAIKNIEKLFPKEKVDCLIKKDWGKLIKVVSSKSVYEIPANIQERLSLVSIQCRDISVLYSGLQNKKLNHMLAINDINSIKEWIEVLIRYPQKPYSSKVTHDELYNYLERCDDFIHLIKDRYIDNDFHYQLPYSSSHSFVDEITQFIAQLMRDLTVMGVNGDVESFVSNYCIFSEPQEPIVRHAYLFKERLFFEVITEANQLIAKHPNKNIAKKFYVDNCLPFQEKACQHYDQMLNSSERTKAELDKFFDEKEMNGAFYSPKGVNINFNLSEKDNLAYERKLLNNIIPGEHTNSLLLDLFNSATEGLLEGNAFTQMLPGLWNNQGGVDSFFTQICNFYATIHFKPNSQSKLYAQVNAIRHVKLSLFELIVSRIKKMPKGVFYNESSGIIKKNREAIKTLHYSIRNAAITSDYERLKNHVQVAPKIVSIAASCLGAYYAIYSMVSLFNKDEWTQDDWLKVSHSAINLGFSLTGLHLQDIERFKGWLHSGDKFPTGLNKLSTFVGKVAAPVSIVLDLYFAIDAYKNARTRGNDLEMQLIVVGTGCSVVSSSMVLILPLLHLSLGVLAVAGGIGIILCVIGISAQLAIAYFKDNYLTLAGINGLLKSLGGDDSFFRKQYLSSHNPLLKNHVYMKDVRQNVEKGAVKAFSYYAKGAKIRELYFDDFCQALWGCLQQIEAIPHCYVNPDIVIYNLSMKGLLKPHIYKLFDGREKIEERSKQNIFSIMNQEPSAISTKQLLENDIDGKEIDIFVSQGVLVKLTEEKYSVIDERICEGLALLPTLQAQVSSILAKNMGNRLYVTKAQFMKLKGFNIGAFQTLLKGNIKQRYDLNDKYLSFYPYQDIRNTAINKKFEQLLMRAKYSYSLKSFNHLPIEKQKCLAVEKINRFLRVNKNNSPWVFYNEGKGDKQKEIAKSVVKKEIAERLMVLIESSHLIEQGETDFAWGVAFYSIFIKLFPCQFVDFALKLFTDGAGYLGVNYFDLEPYKPSYTGTKPLAEKDKLKYRKSGLLTDKYRPQHANNQKADWILLSVLYNCYFSKKCGQISSFEYKGGWPLDLFEKEFCCLPFENVITNPFQGDWVVFYSAGYSIVHVTYDFFYENGLLDKDYKNYSSNQHCIVVKGRPKVNGYGFEMIFWQVGALSWKKHIFGLDFLKKNVIEVASFLL